VTVKVRSHRMWMRCSAALQRIGWRERNYSSNPPSCFKSKIILSQVFSRDWQYALNANM